MSIRDAQGKLAITPGEWEFIGNRIISSVRGRDVGDTEWSENPEPDGLLFAEAGTVANRYDATPAEMVETIRYLRAELHEAKESIESWATYASDYFQNKHDLQGNLDHLDRVLAKTSKYEETK